MKAGYKVCLVAFLFSSHFCMHGMLKKSFKKKSLPLFQCSHDPCSFQDILSQLGEHEQYCQFRKITCKHCSLQVCLSDIENHEENCPSNKKKTCNVCGFEGGPLAVERHQKKCLSIKQKNNLNCVNKKHSNCDPLGFMKKLREYREENKEEFY